MKPRTLLRARCRLLVPVLLLTLLTACGGRESSAPATAAPTPTPDALFSDDFEEGGTTDWTPAEETPVPSD